MTYERERYEREQAEREIKQRGNWVLAFVFIALLLYLFFGGGLQWLTSVF